MTARGLRGHFAYVREQLAAGDDRGQATAFVAGAVAAAWLFAGIVVDGGLAMAAKARATDVAQEAARTGAQQLDIGSLRNDHTVRLVPGRAAGAARRYVASTGDRPTVSVRGTAVTVHVTHHQSTQILKLVGVRSLPAGATATAHAERGAQ